MLFEQLERITARPDVFSVYTAEELWTDAHTSERMLDFHLNGDVALASRTTTFIERSLAWLTDLAELDHRSAVLDLGCGPGLYTNRLALTGAAVVGVDFSERSIRHAERTAPDAARPSYIMGNYLDVDVPGEFDLVLLAFCDLCPLSPAQRHRLLRRVRSWLRPGGRFVFDVHGTTSLRERDESVTYAPNLMDGFWSPDPYHGFLTTFVYRDASVTLDKYDIIEARRWRTIYNWLQHFDDASLAHELQACGLVIDHIVGDLTGTPPTEDPHEYGVVARRA